MNQGKQGYLEGLAKYPHKVLKSLFYAKEPGRYQAHGV